MKKIVALFLTITMIALTASFTISAESEKTVLKVYNWGEYISNGDDDSLDVIAEFEKRFPEIDVQYSTYPTNEEMYAKIVSGSADYDIVIPSDYMIGKMIKEDMLVKLNYDNIENYKKIDDTFKNLEFDPKNEYSVPYTWGTVGIIYNKTKVSEPVDSWDMLWNEKYKDQILMFNNPRDSYGIAAKKLGYSQNSTNRAELDEMTEVLKQQKSVIQAYVMDEIFPKMTNGEAALAPYYAGDALTMIGDNPDLGFVVPKEGSNTFVDSMVILKSSKNKEIAEKFINYMLEDDVALANIEFIGYSTPMTQVRNMLPDEIKNSPISYPNKELLASCDTFTYLDDETAAYMQEGWTNVLAHGENNTVGIIMLTVVVLAVGAVLFLLYRKKKRDR